MLRLVPGSYSVSEFLIPIQSFVAVVTETAINKSIVRFGLPRGLAGRPVRALLCEPLVAYLSGRVVLLCKEHFVSARSQ